MIKKIFFDITKCCNAKCVYCFTNSVNFNSEFLKKELEDSRILKLIDEAKALLIPSISIGGGEPFLRDIPAIGNYAKGKVKLSITSNGTILNDKILEYLKSSETKLTISLDAIDQKISEKIRQGIDTNLCIKNIKTLAKYPEILPRLSIRSVISSNNFSHIFEVIRFCNENKIENLKINSTNYFGRAKENTNVILPFDEFVELLDKIREYCLKNQIHTNVELPISKYLTGSNSCLCGNTSIYIDSIGNVFPCAFTEENLLWGNLKDQSLADIINKNRDFSHQNSFCNKCPINRYKDYNKNFSEYDRTKS